MKILIVFIDMVRVDHLNTYNPRAKESLLDKRIRRLGGVLFTRCYTPGPDTPRSIACMQTGLYPYFNGCDTRIRWPKFFIKDDITTIWDHISELGGVINLCHNRNEVITGFFRYCERSNVRMFDNPQYFLEQGDFSDGSVSFIGIPDMHTALGDYKASDFAFRKGDEVVDLFFSKYLNDEFVSQFDYTIIFSDHGFQMESEHNKMRSKMELLNDSRNQLLMFVHKKGDKEIRIDNRIASMVDLYATLEGLIGKFDFRQGYSLLEKPVRKTAHVEDHTDFLVYPEIMIKQWRVISDNYDIRTDVNNTIVDKGTESDKEKAFAYLMEFSPKYVDYVKQLKVWGYYDKLVSKNNHHYFAGVDRESHFILFFFKAYYKLRRMIGY